jgi:hypothetical protein
MKDISYMKAVGCLVDEFEKAILKEGERDLKASGVPLRISYYKAL